MKQLTRQQKKEWIKTHWNGFDGKTLARVLTKYFQQTKEVDITTGATQDYIDTAEEIFNGK